jgi:hypothetical protein
VTCGLVVMLISMLMSPANAQQKWCPTNRVFHVLVGRDEYWIPTRYNPHFDVDEGEQRGGAKPQISGSRLIPAVLCQKPNEPAWRVRRVSVQIRDVTDVQVPRPANVEGLQALIAISLLKRRADFKLPTYPPWANSQPYWETSDGRYFLSRDNIFLGSKLEISTTPGFMALMVSPIGRDTIVKAHAVLSASKKMPSDRTIDSLARLVAEWKPNSK